MLHFSIIDTIYMKLYFKETFMGEINGGIIIKGNVNGAVIEKNDGTINIDLSESKFDKEIAQAKSIVEEFDELDDAQKNELINLFDEVKKSKNKKEYVEKFKKIVKASGKAGAKLIELLANLSSIASFFALM